jgi:hypothetical protein
VQLDGAELVESSQPLVRCGEAGAKGERRLLDWPSFTEHSLNEQHSTRERNSAGSMDFIRALLCTG